MLIRKRYRGNIHDALRTWSVSWFSTTAIWNCLGRNIIAIMERNRSDAHSV